MDRESLKAWCVNSGILAFVSWANAESLLKCSLLLLTIAYTIRRWWVNEQRKSKGEKSFETEIIEKED